MRVQNINSMDNNIFTSKNKRPSFRGHYENYIKKFDLYANQHVGKGYSSSFNKSFILHTYKELINELKQFPAKCRTPLFDEVFNDPKYIDSPYELLRDLHKGEGSNACKALSVEASKYQGCHDTPCHLAYPLVIDDKSQKACLILERFEVPLIRKGIDFLLDCDNEKNGFYSLRFNKNFVEKIIFGLGNKKNVTFLNASEEINYFHRIHYPTYLFNEKFEFISSYDNNV